MAIKYPEDRARFISDLRAAGLPAGRASSLELAELLGFSVSHIKNLFYGVNRYGSTTKDKLDALIAAKANGPEPVEQFEVDLAATDKPVDRGLYVEIDPLIELKHRLRGMIESAVQIHPGSDQMVVDSYAVRAVYDRLRQILPNKELA